MVLHRRAVAIRVTLVMCICIVVVVASVLAHSVSARSQQGLRPRSASNQASGVCTSWYVSPGQNPSPQDSRFADVAAISSSDIWAVGSYYMAGVTAYQTLFEHFNGATWSVVPSSNAGSVDNHLQKLAVVSSTDIWAVGSSQSTRANYSTLIEHWDGTQWSIVPSPNGIDPSVENNYLTGVAAVAADDVWAVGYYESVATSTLYSSLIEHWDGTSWTIVDSPAVGSLVTVPTAVTAIAANDVWVVGHYANAGSEVTAPLFENWNGTSWTVVPAANTGWEDSEPQAVTAVSASDIWAVGHGGLTGSFSDQSLAEHWNGTAWSVVPSPNVNSSPAFLLGVTSLGSNDVWAVGYYGVPSPIYREPVIMRWNGSAWTIVTSPNLGTYSNLLSIIALSPTSLWTVGWILAGTGQNQPPQVLIEHYNPRIAIACGAP